LSGREEALISVKSAIKFYIETFGDEAVEVDEPILSTNNMIRNVDELISTSRRTDLGQVCPILNHKS